VLVAGSRDWCAAWMINAVLEALFRQVPIDCVISGEACGADTLGASWALSHGIEVMRFPADWAKHGKRAGYLRNQQMLDEGLPGLVVVFNKGGSPGSTMMAELSRKSGVQTVEVRA